MRAELRGSGLDVQPLSDKFQLIDGVTGWAWRVTPQTDGVRTLRLTLVVELNDLPLSSRTFERAIAVDAETQPPWYEWAWGLLDVAGVVVTAIVIAAILGSAKLARVWWVRRKAEEEAAGEDSGTAADAPDVSAPTESPPPTGSRRPPPTGTSRIREYSSSPVSRGPIR
ncbi:hypothetical protein OG555_17235 [Kribbella sp. NBC_01484]|uniref:hypothetical protein n=1 Tax=Kribbella sp. NBC_01484 TaxID=2903579 RepID=UPI002E342BA2|nr:hypothetical protein [Kribbella sp. NBC_01484]